ncbi:taurine ABC transporter permease [Zavarzinia compransoris]|uniref:Taurine ABC transporter permease n=2 Tax=Zavarzinia compransoris TaxID=1264899 RepID=A0A317DT72_9PROT|nr:taurine ABC transporter permease [Zavarzinia compransoris]
MAAARPPRGVALVEGLALPVLLVAFWDLSSRLGWLDGQVWAAPGVVLAGGVGQAFAAETWIGLGHSLFRHALGFVLGALAGTGVGFALGASRVFERLFGPVLNATKQVAIFTWIPLMSIWLGTGETAKVAFVALAVFFPLMISAAEGVRAIDPRFVEVARAFRLTRWQRLRRLVLPGAMPALVGGVQVGLIYAWLAVIGADYFFEAAPGLGSQMLNARDQFRMDILVFDMLVIGGVGLLFLRLAGALEARVLRWRPRAAR